mmetsp:Transcript_16948/g.14881  ORF Transcript_16948/g.14881 Transcript_16948/m.14881 type:complete len:120 (-) Transcript_16948:392-751(-)
MKRRMISNAIENLKENIFISPRGQTFKTSLLGHQRREKNARTSHNSGAKIKRKRPKTSTKGDIRNIFNQIKILSMNKESDRKIQLRISANNINKSQVLTGEGYKHQFSSGLIIDTKSLK